MWQWSSNSSCFIYSFNNHTWSLDLKKKGVSMQNNSCEKPNCNQGSSNYLIILVLYILLAILLGSTLFY